MIEAFVVGVFAGYAIAIPVGPIAILILRTGMRDGRRAGIAAGAGAATVDLLYAAVAMFAGPALIAVLAPLLLPARLIAAGLLFALAARQIVAVDLSSEPREPAAATRTYATVVGLTLVNPSTVIYFASLAVGLPAIATDAASRALFVAGAGLSSLSWQSLLAVVGSALHGRIPPGATRATALVSSAVIAILALAIVRDALLSP